MVGCWNLEWRLVPSNPKPSVILYNCSTAACSPACTDGFSHPQHRTLHSSLFQQETPISLELHLLKLTSWSSTAPSLFLSATFQGLSDFNQQANTGPVYWCRSQLLWPYSLSQLKWMLIVQAFVSCCFSAETQKILSCFVQFLLDSADARGCRMPLFPWTSWFKDLMLFSASQFTPTENPLSCFLASFCLGPTTCFALDAQCDAVCSADICVWVHIISSCVPGNVHQREKQSMMEFLYQCFPQFIQSSIFSSKRGDK